MFTPLHLSRWLRGSILVGPPDQIPDDALRIARNVRLDRILGTLTTRPGMERRTQSALGGTITLLTRLFGVLTWGYVQAGTALLRLTNTWGGATAIVSGGVGVQSLSTAASPDGAGVPWAYFVHGTVAIKDNGTLTYPMGIAAPGAPPLSVALGEDLFTSISQMDDAVAWPGSNISVGPANDATNWIEPPSSVSFSVAASTFGSITTYRAPGALNLDTLIGGDPLVKDDDYIHLWVRCSRPDWVTFLQIDIDIDSTTTGVADAFQHNYYHVRLGGLGSLNQGANSWTQVQVRKASFQRIGSDLARTWAHARTFRLGILTSALGSVDVNIDDFKLRGGVGIEGDIEYTVSYRNSSTGARGNPPMDDDRIVQYTLPLRVDRQRPVLTITNVVQGGADHPGDAQIDTLMVWRRGGAFPDTVLVDELTDIIPANTFTDTLSDSTLALTNEVLETDNDPPPAGSTRVLFGPGASGHLFMLVDGHKCYFSKAFERRENRAENWGADNYVLIGDGSARAVAGLATASRILAWTTERTYGIVGIGEDTFLPVIVDGSHGCVGQHAVCSGSNVVFFVSQDGIYEDRNGRQQKLTGAIDPFFEGRTVDGQPGWNKAVEAMAMVRLSYLNEPTGAALVMAYAEAGSGTLTHFLTLKPNLNTGALTECFFGVSALGGLGALYWDSLSNELLAGIDDHVYRIEDPTALDDAGQSIPWVVRTRSLDAGEPQRPKQVSHAMVEGSTSGADVTMTAVYDRGSINEVLGTIATLTETTLAQLPVADATARRHDIALELEGSATEALALFRLGIMVEPQPEPRIVLDSGLISFDFPMQLKRFEWDMEVPAASELRIYIDGPQVFLGQALPTAGRENQPYRLPPGLRGRVWRVTLRSSAGPILCWRWSGFFKALGNDTTYTERLLVQGV